MTSFPTVTAFAGEEQIAAGPLDQVALKLARRVPQAGEPAVLAFDDQTGRVVDLDLRGPESAILERLGASYPALAPAAARGPGRPRLGVVAREVTLLPHHWEWLASQSGGASAVLRKLVDHARRDGAGADDQRRVEERTYRFIHAMAGDLPGYEEATRSLFAHDLDGFAQRMSGWPKDVRHHALKLLRGNSSG